MHVVGVAPLQVGSLVWRERDAFLFTVVCKATYRILSGHLEPAPEPEPIRAEDEHAGGDEAKSLVAPTDLVPRKARADVMVVGHAYAPRGAPVRSLVARIVMGPVDKEVEVFCDRTWTREGVLREAGRFRKMPLSYERAGGGPGTSNPLGVRTGPAAQPDAQGVVSLPNLQPVGGTPGNRRDPIKPIGFSPIPASFPDRVARLGRRAEAGAPSLDAPLPDDFDYAYFNAAPPDQQLPMLRGGEQLILQNLSREHPRLLTTVPASRPRAFVERSGAQAREVTLRCDALWIDADKAICTLTWRGEVTLASRDERGRVICAMEETGKRIGYEEALALAGPVAEGAEPAPVEAGAVDRGFARTPARGLGIGLGVAAADAGGGLAARPPASPPEPAPLLTSAMLERIPSPVGASSLITPSPVGASSLITPPPVGASLIAPPPVGASSLITPPSDDELGGIDVEVLQGGPTSTLPSAIVATARVAVFQPPDEVLPFARDAGPSPFARSTGEPGPMRPRSNTIVGGPGTPGNMGPAWLAAMQPAAPPPAPPPPSPPTPVPPAPPVGAAGVGPAWLAAPSPSAPAPPAPPAPAPAAPLQMGVAPAWLAPAPPPAPATPAPPPAAVTPVSAPPPAAPRFGEPPPSPVAATPAPSPAPPPVAPAPPAPAVTVPRPGLRSDEPAFAPGPGPRASAGARDAIDLLWADPAAAPKILRAFGDLLADLAPPADSDPDEAAAEWFEAAVVRVLASGKGRDAAGLDAALAGAVGADGRFRSPVVLVAGELGVAFDALETLRATLAAATAFAGDRRVREAVDAVNDLLATPGIEPASGATDQLASRVREAIVQGRAISMGMFGAQIERILLERRAYQRRAVLGGDHVCTHVTLAGAEAACPVYLPEAVSAALPMFPAFDARILAEAHHAQDHLEAHPIALRALAIGRVLPARRRGR